MESKPGFFTTLPIYNKLMDSELNLQLTLTPELLKGLQEESNFTKTPIETVVNHILERVLFTKVGKPRISGPASIGGQRLQKVTGPTTTNWK